MAEVLKTHSARMASLCQQIPTDLLNDLSSRFVINVPEEERVDLIRICFQIELAHWFYLDFYCEEDPKLPKCSVKDFIRIIFGHIPFLQEYSPGVDTIIADWKEYKMAVPTYGAILLDKELKNVLLVQSFVSKASWSFPKGKVNKDEQPHHCAIREVFEETGFDISHLIDKQQYLEHHFNDMLIRLYIITGVPANVKFHPKTRNEIKNIEWFPISSLPTGKKDQVCKTSSGPITFFMVIPFVKQLKKWIAARDNSPDNDDNFLQQKKLFAKLSQGVESRYRDFTVSTESNHTNVNDHRTNRSNHGKSTYSPPPRMLRQKNLKQAMETDKKKNIQSQTEERSHTRHFKKSLDFTKENKQNREKYVKKEKFYPYSKTWINFSLNTASLIAVFNTTMDLHKVTSASAAKG